MVFRRVIELRQDFETPPEEPEVSSVEEYQLPSLDVLLSNENRPAGASVDEDGCSMDHPHSIEKELALLRRVRLHTRQFSSTQQFPVKLLRLETTRQAWTRIGSGYCYGRCDSVSTRRFWLLICHTANTSLSRYKD